MALGDQFYPLIGAADKKKKKTYCQKGGKITED